MPRSAIRTTLKSLLQGLSTVSFALAGLSFFFGGRAIHEFGGVERMLAEMVGIGVAFVCFIIGVIAKGKIDDIESEEQNEEAEQHQQSLEEKMNKPDP
jgi:hypothetical protein